MRLNKAVPTVYVVTGLEAPKAQKRQKLPEWSNSTTWSFYNSNQYRLFHIY